MSDISFVFLRAALVTFMVIMYGPALLFGLVFGAFAWRRHRIFGAALGALAGVGLGIEFWDIYEHTALSVSMSATEVIATALTRTWPALVLGAAAGAWLWRSRRVFGGACGALVGFMLGLCGWVLFKLM
jgi:hypothetical protein